jgi:hypothetical protein
LSACCTVASVQQGRVGSMYWQWFCENITVL